MSNKSKGQIIIEETSSWNELPKPESNLIALLRQFVATEYDGSRLYTHIPSLDNIESTGAMEALILKYGTQEETREFYDLLESSDSGVFPFAGTLHDYLRKHDTEWYQNTYKAKFR